MIYLIFRWNSFASNVTSALGLKPGGPINVLGLSFAGSDYGNGGFSPQQAYADGLLTGSAGGFVKV